MSSLEHEENLNKIQGSLVSFVHQSACVFPLCVIDLLCMSDREMDRDGSRLIEKKESVRDRMTQI